MKSTAPKNIGFCAGKSHRQPLSLFLFRLNHKGRSSPLLPFRFSCHECGTVQLQPVAVLVWMSKVWDAKQAARVQISRLIMQKWLWVQKVLVHCTALPSECSLLLRLTCRPKFEGVSFLCPQRRVVQNNCQRQAENPQYSNWVLQLFFEIIHSQHFSV